MNDDALDYRARADRHRPQDSERIARTCRCLALQGLTERDIVDTLRLDPTTVRAALADVRNASETCAGGQVGKGR